MPKPTDKPLKVVPIDTTDFYADPNAVYIKLTYIPDVDGFKFQILNEILNKYTPETVPDEVVAITQFIRGLVQIGINYPFEMRKIGLQAQNAEAIDTTDMEADYKELLKGEPRGSA